MHDAKLMGIFYIAIVSMVPAVSSQDIVSTAPRRDSQLRYQANASKNFMEFTADLASAKSKADWVRDARFEAIFRCYELKDGVFQFEGPSPNDSKLEKSYSYVKDCVVFLPDEILLDNSGNDPKYEGSDFREKYETIQIIELFSEEMNPRVLHLRPCIDGFTINGRNELFRSKKLKRSFDWLTSLDAPLPRSSFSGFSLPPWSYSLYDYGHTSKEPIEIAYHGTPIRKAYVIARYFASIADFRGNVKLAQLRSNDKLKFRLFHPVLGHDFAGVKIGNSDVDENGYFEITLKSGENDFGLIDITPVVKRYNERKEAEFADALKRNLKSEAVDDLILRVPNLAGAVLRCDFEQLQYAVENATNSEPDRRVLLFGSYEFPDFIKRRFKKQGDWYVVSDEQRSILKKYLHNRPDSLINKLLESKLPLKTSYRKSEFSPNPLFPYGFSFTTDVHDCIFFVMSDIAIMPELASAAVPK